MRPRLFVLAALALLALAVPAQARVQPPGPPPVGHVFVVFLENENADVTFAPDSRSTTGSPT